MRGKDGANADAFASILTMQWRKNTHPKRVRILTQLLNLIFNAELLVLAVIAFLLHIFLNFPIAIAYVLLGLWIFLALLITAGLGVLSRGTPPPPFQKNVNPYSKTTKDFTDNSQHNDKESES